MLCKVNLLTILYNRLLFTGNWNHDPTRHWYKYLCTIEDIKLGYILNWMSIVVEIACQSMLDAVYHADCLRSLFSGHAVHLEFVIHVLKSRLRFGTFLDDMRYIYDFYFWMWLNYATCCELDPLMEQQFFMVCWWFQV